MVITSDSINKLFSESLILIFPFAVNLKLFSLYFDSSNLIFRLLDFISAIPLDTFKILSFLLYENFSALIIKFLSIDVNFPLEAIMVSP